MSTESINEIKSNLEKLLPGSISHLLLRSNDRPSSEQRKYSIDRTLHGFTLCLMSPKKDEKCLIIYKFRIKCAQRPLCKCLKSDFKASQCITRNTYYDNSFVCRRQAETHEYFLFIEATATREERTNHKMIIEYSFRLMIG